MLNSNFSCELCILSSRNYKKYRNSDNTFISWEFAWWRVFVYKYILANLRWCICHLQNPTPLEIRKSRSYPFKKGQPRLRAFKIVESPHSKKQKVERPKTPILTDFRFPKSVGSYQIRNDSGYVSRTQDLTIPTGNNISIMEILSLVFEYLNCTNCSCYVRLKLYERLIQDVLQRFLLPKFTHCHYVVDEFPTSLPIDVAALDTINNISVRSKGESEIKQRALIAVHTTSAS